MQQTQPQPRRALRRPATMAVGVVTALLLLGTSALVACSSAESLEATPPSTIAGVTPTLVVGDNPGGNVTCDEVDAGAFQWVSERTDRAGDQFSVPISDGLTQVGNVVVTVNPDTKEISFESTIGIEVAIVKGSDAANVYDYRPTPVTVDAGLLAPLNRGAQLSDLSNITFCTNPQTIVDPAWCSPGYWRQPQHLGSWAATGFSPTDRYLDQPSIASVPFAGRAPAGANPTLLEVLQSPQMYGGPAFNAVGDLLSDAHPDVNWSFGDERVEDSCPLN